MMRASGQDKKQHRRSLLSPSAVTSSSPSHKAKSHPSTLQIRRTRRRRRHNRHGTASSATTTRRRRRFFCFTCSVSQLLQLLLLVNGCVLILLAVHTRHVWKKLGLNYHHHDTNSLQKAFQDFFQQRPERAATSHGTIINNKRRHNIAGGIHLENMNLKDETNTIITTTTSRRSIDDKPYHHHRHHNSNLSKTRQRILDLQNHASSTACGRPLLLDVQHRPAHGCIRHETLGFPPYCRFQNLRIDLDKITTMMSASSDGSTSSDVLGGESLTDPGVMGRKEESEILRYELGAFTVPKPFDIVQVDKNQDASSNTTHTSTIYTAQPGKPFSAMARKQEWNYMRTVLNATLVDENMDASSSLRSSDSYCEHTVTKPTLFIARQDYVNLYYTTLDLAAGYYTILPELLQQNSAKQKLDKNHTFNVVFLDAHAQGGLDGMWDVLFGGEHFHVRRLPHRRTCFETAISIPHGSLTHLYRASKANKMVQQDTVGCSSLTNAFVDFVLNAYGFRGNDDDDEDYEAMNSSSSVSPQQLEDVPVERGRVTIIDRRPYVAHPRIDISQVQVQKNSRVLDGLQEAADWIEKSVPGTKVSVVQLHDMPMHEQIRLLRKTHVLIGNHGAGLTNLLYLHHHARAIEFGLNTVAFASLAFHREHVLYSNLGQVRDSVLSVEYVEQHVVPILQFEMKVTAPHISRTAQAAMAPLAKDMIQKDRAAQNVSGSEKEEQFTQTSVEVDMSEAGAVEDILPRKRPMGRAAIRLPSDWRRSSATTIHASEEASVIDPSSVTNSRISNFLHSRDTNLSKTSQRIINMQNEPDPCGGVIALDRPSHGCIIHDTMHTPYCRFENLMIDIDKIESGSSMTGRRNALGGEPLNETGVMNQDELVEFLRYQAGAFTVSRPFELIIAHPGNSARPALYTQLESVRHGQTVSIELPEVQWDYLRDVLKATRVDENFSSSSRCENTVATPTLFIARNEYVNLYFATLDYLGGYLSALPELFLQNGIDQTVLKEKGFQVIFLDAHPEGGLDRGWDEMFGGGIPHQFVRRLPNQRTCFEQAIFVPNGKTTYLFRNSKINSSDSIMTRAKPCSAVTNGFVDFVLNSHGLKGNFDDDDDEMSPLEDVTMERGRVTIIDRRPYAAHARSNVANANVANAKRILHDLPDVTRWIEEAVPGTNATVVDFVDLGSVENQLRLLRKTHILIANHGAGLTNLAYLHNDAHVLEFGGGTRAFQTLSYHRENVDFNLLRPVRGKGFVGEAYVNERIVPKLKSIMTNSPMPPTGVIKYV